MLCVHVVFNLAHTLYVAVNGNVECARILLQTSQNDDRNAVNCVDKLERFGAVLILHICYAGFRKGNASAWCLAVPSGNLLRVTHQGTAPS